MFLQSFCFIFISFAFNYLLCSGISINNTTSESQTVISGTLTLRTVLDYFWRSMQCTHMQWAFLPEYLQQHKDIQLAL